MLTIFASGNLFAQNSRIATIPNLTAPFQLNSHIETIEDAERKYNYTDIAANNMEPNWQPTTGHVFIGHHAASRYWFRLRFDYLDEPLDALHEQQHAAAQNTEGVIYIPAQAFLIHRLKAWIATPDNQLVTIESGYIQPIAARQLKNRQIAIPLQLKKGRYQIIGWLDNEILNRPAILPVTLMTLDQYMEDNQVLLGVLVAFYSIMGALLIYNGGLYLTLKQPMYGLYLLFLLGAIYECAYADGTTGLWLWVNDPNLNIRIAAVNTVMVPATYLFFLRTALREMPLVGFLKHCFRALILISVLCSTFDIFTDRLDTAAAISKLYVFLSLPFALIVILIATYKKIPTARYLLIAETCAILGGISMILMAHGVIPANQIVFWSLHAGFLSESLLLSLALAARTRILQDESMTNLHKYQMLYEQSLEGLFEFNLITRIMHSNLSFARMFGYDRTEDLPPMNDPLGFFNFEDREALPTLLRQDGKVVEYETLVHSPKLIASTWVSLTLRVVKDEKGKALFVEGTIRDINERKLKEEAERLQLRAEGEKNKAEQERKSAELANQAKSQFFASISHEFRTPLTAILGYASSGIGDEVNPLQKDRNFQIIKESGRYMLQLVNDILDLSKIEARRLEVENIRIDLFEILETIDNAFLILCKNKGITFSIDYNFPLPEKIETDPTRLKQVLINLCGNAVKFTQKGGVTLFINCDKKREHLHFAVKDTGIGIKPDQLDQVFDAFSQAEISTTREYGGTGLGLYLSKMIAEKLGGDINFESTFGKGSTFTLTIKTGNLSTVNWVNAPPVITVAQGNEQKFFARESANSSPQEKNIHAESVAADYVSSQISKPTTTEHQVQCTKNGGGKSSPKVLLAEDNPVNQQLISFHLRQFGAEVVIVNDGVEALTQAMTKEFDLILMDMLMPVMGGLEAVAKLRAKDYAGLIYALTSNVGEEAIKECEAAGCSGHLEKPLDTTKLDALIRSLNKT